MINRNVVLFSEMALNKNISYGSFIYELIKYNLYFPYILSSLDKTEVISNDNTNKKISAEEQMLYLLNKLVAEFDKYFPLQYAQRNTIIGKLLGLNITIDYLHSKYYYDDKENYDYYTETIKKIFITVFYDNLKYNHLLYKDIFKEKRINYNKLDINNPTHINKLLNLLSDLTYCNLSNDSSWLFDDIESHLIRDRNSNYRKKQKNAIENEKRIISTNNKYIIEIISNYNSKKEYLKYFKQNKKNIILT